MIGQWLIPLTITGPKGERIWVKEKGKMGQAAAKRAAGRVQHLQR